MSVATSDAARSAPETQLLLRIAQGDREAFATLFMSIGPQVQGYLIGIGCTAAAAEEFTQDVMVTVWRKAALFDPTKAGARTWIFTIARNRRIDGLRRERSVTTYGATPPDEVDPNAVAPNDAVIGAEIGERIRTAFTTLPADQREVVRLAFFEDEPHSKIAKTLGVPLGTVKSRLRLAMNKLRAHLEELR